VTPARRRAPFVEWVRAHRTALWIAAAALLLRVVYVYCFTDYENYLFGDMGAYWKRALHRYEGKVYGDSEYNMWPVGYHLTMVWGLRLADFLELGKWKLEFILFLQMAAQAGSIGMFYEIAEKLLRNRKRALLCAGLYTVFYQMLYMSAFILSENGALAAFIWAIWLAYTRTKHLGAHAAAGLLCALAAGWCPRFAPLAAPLAVYFLFNEAGPLPRVKRLVFPLVYALGVAFWVFVSYTISGGKVRGIGLGGHAFMQAQCQTHTLVTEYDGYVWAFVPPTHVPIPERKVFKATVPFYEQDYWYAEGRKCLKQNPRVLVDNVLLQGRLFVGALFPRVSSARGYFAGMAVGSIAIILLYLIGIVAAPFIWTKRRDPRRLEYWTLWSLMAFTHFLTYWFSVERRYMFTMVFVLLILSFSALPSPRETPNADDS
jgi:hypothetical protein